MLSAILQGTPVWVWPLLLFLILIGLRATRTRTIPAFIFYFLPLLGLITLSNVMQLPNPPLAWTTFIATYIAGFILGYRLQRRWLISKQGKRITLKGERFTLACILILFAMNFASGFIQSVAPELYNNTGFLIAYVVTGGVVSGTFAGRAARIWFT